MMEAPSQRTLLLYRAWKNLTDLRVMTAFSWEFHEEIQYVKDFIQENNGLKKLLIDLKKM